MVFNIDIRFKLLQALSFTYSLRYGLAQKCIELNDKENEKVCMSKALRYSHLIRDKGFIEDVIRLIVELIISSL